MKSELDYNNNDMALYFAYMRIINLEILSCNHKDDIPFLDYQFFGKTD